MKKHREIYKGRVLDITLETASLPDGRDIELEIIHHPGGACALPVYENGDLLLIRQFRHAAGGIIWEVPAGRIDDGEEPEACARRELAEEGGVTAGKLRKLGQFYSTPGFCTEVIHIFLATELEKCGQKLEEDEYLETTRIPFEKAIDMVFKGEINDSKTMLAILLAREELCHGPA